MTNPLRCATLPCRVRKIRIRDGVPKLYLLTIAGYEDREVPLRSKDLIFRSRLVNRVLEGIDQLVSPPKDDDLNKLLATAERIEADDRMGEIVPIRRVRR